MMLSGMSMDRLVVVVSVVCCAVVVILVVVCVGEVVNAVDSCEVTSLGDSGSMIMSLSGHVSSFKLIEVRYLP